jgi:hypothetical protein
MHTAKNICNMLTETIDNHNGGCGIVSLLTTAVVDSGGSNLLTEENRAYLEMVAGLLKRTGSLTQTAAAVGKTPSTLHTQIRRFGYRVRYEAYLEPINAPEIEAENAA